MQILLKVNAEGAANNVQTIELICLNIAALQRTLYLNFRCGQIQHRGFVSLHHIQFHHTAPILIDPPLNAKKRRIVNSTKPTIRRLNFCDIYFLKISVHVCISVAQQENTVAILPKIWKSPCSSLGEQGLSSMEKQKNFRAFCARKALRTLRLTQCPQNWLTMMEAPPRLELGVADLQSAALPLGYGAICSPAQTELI